MDAELVVAEKGKQDAPSLAELAKTKNVDAIMTNWAKVPKEVIAAPPSAHRLPAGDWPGQHRCGVLHRAEDSGHEHSRLLLD